MLSAGTARLTTASARKAAATKATRCRPWSREASGDDPDPRPQAGRAQAVQLRRGRPGETADAEGRRETGQQAEGEGARDPPRAGVAPPGLEPFEGRRGDAEDLGRVPDHRRPASTQRKGPIAEQGADRACFGRGPLRLACGDLPVELPEQQLARLCVAQAREHVADGLPCQRLGQRRRLERVARASGLPRCAGRLGRLRGRRRHGRQHGQRRGQQRGEQRRRCHCFPPVHFAEMSNSNNSFLEFRLRIVRQAISSNPNRSNITT